MPEGFDAVVAQGGRPEAPILAWKSRLSSRPFSANRASLLRWDRPYPQHKRLFHPGAPGDPL